MNRFEGLWRTLTEMLKFVAGWVGSLFSADGGPARTPAEEYAANVEALWRSGAIVPARLIVQVETPTGTQPVWPSLIGVRAVAPRIVVLRLRAVVGWQTVGDLIAALPQIESMLSESVISWSAVDGDVNALDLTVGRQPRFEDLNPPDSWRLLRPAWLWNAYIGLAADGTDVYLCPSGCSGLIVSGSPGTGKTVAIRRIVAELLAGGAVGSIIDFKAAGDYAAFDGLATVVGDDLDEALRLARRVVEDMNERQSQLRDAGFHDYWAVADRMPLEFLVVDEVQDGLDATGADKARKAKAAELEALLTRLAKKGRSAGVFLILGSQKIASDAIPTRLRDVLPLRISGFQSTIEAARAAMGELRDGQPRPDQLPARVPGRMVLSDGGSAVVVQTPPMPDDVQVRQWLGLDSGAGPAA